MCYTRAGTVLHMHFFQLCSAGTLKTKGARVTGWRLSKAGGFFGRAGPSKKHILSGSPKATKRGSSSIEGSSSISHSRLLKRRLFQNLVQPIWVLQEILRWLRHENVGLDLHVADLSQGGARAWDLLWLLMNS